MAALSIPSANCLMIVDYETSSGGSISSPSPPMGAWQFPIPPGGTALSAAAAFANEQSFPVGTVAVIIDLSVTPVTVRGFSLTSSWVAD